MPLRSSTARWPWWAARCARTSTSPRTWGSPTRRTGCSSLPRRSSTFPDEKVVVISTGSQGEPLSALRRMAHPDHPDVELHSGDTVIFSATPIPGNERSVNETIDRIFQIGAQVVTAADAPIHASGHGWQEELKLMLNLTKPQLCVSLPRRLQAPQLHADLAESVGIDPRPDLQGAKRRSPRDRRVGRPLGRGCPRQHDLRRRRLTSASPTTFALRDRRKLSDDGVFIVVATISSEDGSQVAPPGDHLPRRPVRGGGRRPRDELRDVVQQSLSNAARRRGDPRAVPAPGGPARRRCRLRLRAACAGGPLVLPVIVEV